MVSHTVGQPEVHLHCWYPGSSLQLCRIIRQLYLSPGSEVSTQSKEILQSIIMQTLGTLFFNSVIVFEAASFNLGF